MKLVVITPSKDVPDETSLVSKMFESGLRTLHLRKPQYSTGRMKEYLNEIPQHFHNRIVIHSHHKLALKFKLKGIHLGRSHIKRSWKTFFLRARLRMKFRQTSKSRSYSQLQQVFKVEEQEFDYFLLGTMFNNMTGDLYSGFYEEGVLSANRTSGKRLVARGGTSVASIGKTHDLGFYGIAFNSHLWTADSPYESFLSVLHEFRRLKIPVD